MMNAEQKQAARNLIDDFKDAGNEWDEAAVASHMTALLQELVDAPTADTLLTWTPNDDTGDITDADGNEYYFARENAIAMCRVVMAAHAPEAEPFGYFKSEPFGWTDCAETDDGAIALYTAPPAPSVPDGWRIVIKKEFPLYDEDGIDEDKHCCEWVMLQERKRLHKILAAAIEIDEQIKQGTEETAKLKQLQQLLKSLG